MTTRSIAVRLLSVNVGLPGVIGMRGDEPVVSGIAKQPVAPGLRRLEVVGLEGDGQADLVNHGGVIRPSTRIRQNICRRGPPNWA
ncbi:MAG: hypothetical protein M3R02_03570 [Chloroflexota bacterium]|nr:hypothetical protein [Chloroflexota bacterium]